MIQQEIQIEYNYAQLAFNYSYQPTTVLEWGRGTGKSTIFGRRISDLVHQLPRASGTLTGATYAAILQRTLPSTINGLEMHGLFLGVHYFIGRKPPQSWKWIKPYEPPVDYKRSIIFWNGLCINLVSQDGSASSGRGLNSDFVLADEAALLDEDKFEDDVLLTNRGNLKRIAHYPDGTWKYFKDCPLHHSVLLASTTPVTTAGRWILKYEHEAKMNPNDILFLRASAECNRHNLGDDWFDRQKKKLPDFKYKAEIENIRTTRIEDGFYPLLNEDRHTYSQFNYDYYNIDLKGKPTCLGDADLDLDMPLIGGIDWGARINCMILCQNHSDVEMRWLKNIFVLSPKIIDDMIDEFIRYYKGHRNKTLYLWYDPTGNNKVANSKRTYAEQVKDRLKAAGWTVSLMTVNNHNVLHSDKFKLWNEVLKNEDHKYPDMKWNRANCDETWISMTNAPATQGRYEEIKKDKSSEKKDGNQAHATHFSDAADVIVVGMFLDKMMKPIQFIPNTFN